MNVKDLFGKSESGALTYEEFQQLAVEAKAKFVDLSEGGYVSKDKYTDDLASRDLQITTLNEDIQKRDADLANLNAKLTDAGNDVEKLNQVSTDLTNLQNKYQEDINKYQTQLAEQAYEFAVKDFANGKNFTSQAAKRDFINSMVGKKLTMSEGKIMGADDFVTEYTQNNADAFVVTPAEPSVEEEPKPQFVNKTPGLNEGNNANAFTFNFTGVRSHEEK